MKVGVQLPEVEREVGWPEMKAIALTAEAGGLDSIWVGDHLLYRSRGRARGPWEAWSVLAGLAEATSRVELGPLVAATGFHAPAMLAKKAATVDEISGGRLILGLGAGSNEVDFEAFGFPLDRRVSRFEEAFGVIRLLLAGGAVDLDGEFYQLRGAELLPRPRPGIKLMIGSNGPRVLRIAAPHVDMWNTWWAWFGNRAPGLAPLIESLAEACRDVGRDPEDIEKTAAVYVQLTRGTGRDGGHDREEDNAISGSHDEIASELARFSEVGIDHIQVVLDPIDVAAVEELAEIVALLR
jgi:alkanesulfonate monooxygenase SsuD/methylene tetrahydromethanopterin reductase-like flavin-dependent oxidoreductase (luciferase family)